MPNPYGFMWGSVETFTLQQSAYNFLITLQFGPKKKYNSEKISQFHTLWYIWVVYYRVVFLHVIDTLKYLTG